MGTDIDDKSSGGDLDLVGSEQKDCSEPTRFCHLPRCASARTRREIHIECSHTRGRRVQHAVAIPALRTKSGGNLSGKRGHCCAVRSRQRAHTDDDQRVLRLSKHFRKLVPACCNIGKRLRSRAEMLVRVREIDLLTDKSNGKVSPEPPLAKPGVEHRSFARGGAANEVKGTRLLDSATPGIEQIGRRSLLRIKRSAVLTAIAIGDAKPREQIPQRVY